MKKDKKHVDDELEIFLEGSDEAVDGGSGRVSFQLDVDGVEIGQPELPEIEIDLESEDNTEEVAVDDSAQEEQEPVVKTPAPEVDEAETKRKSRARERIKDLHNKVKQLEAVVNSQNKELQEVKSAYDETTSTYAKVELERLIADTAVLEAKLKTAAEDGDGAAIAAITRQLVDSQTNIRNLQNFQNNQPKETTKKQQTQQPQSSSLSEAAEDWMLGKEFLINNDEYKGLSKDQRKILQPVRQEMAIIARDLLQEGFENHDPFFFEEMDIRLSSKFPFYERLATEGLDALSYLNSDENTNSPNGTSGETEKPQIADKSKNVPTKGPSRSSPQSTTQKKASGPNKVRMTQEMYNYWENHLQRHMTLEEYAQQIVKDQQRTKF
jgi:hypothetical protein